MLLAALVAGLTANPWRRFQRLAIRKTIVCAGEVYFAASVAYRGLLMFPWVV